MTNEEMNKIIRDWVSKPSNCGDNYVAICKLFDEWQYHPITKFIFWYLWKRTHFYKEEIYKDIQCDHITGAKTKVLQIEAIRMLTLLRMDVILNDYIRLDEYIKYIPEFRNEKM